MSSLNVLPFAHIDDDEFSLLINEANYGRINFNEDRLMSLKFQPLLSGSSKGLANSIDLDPDSQLSISDTYYTENKLNNYIASTSLNNSAYLSFLHLNIRSLSRNFDGLVH